LSEASSLDEEMDLDGNFDYDGDEGESIWEHLKNHPESAEKGT